ncbi:hypothetical protein J4E81_001368 [Alternaria sp. BMP 2799]|nr:hypothetical protein J4E81_001368 [Alternaria sp. BMP 2799]
MTDPLRHGDGPSMNNQHQSLLFRLPRELRDRIYEYYTHQEQGYIYDPSAQKFRLANGQNLDVALIYTCKRVAQEIDGLAFESNTIRFSVLPQIPGTETSSSAAFLYRSLLEGRNMCLRIMLSYAYPLVTREALRELRSRYPGNKAVEELEKTIIREGRAGLKEGRLYHVCRLDYLIKDAILQDLIQIIARHPAFERLVLGEYDPSAKTSAPLDYDPVTDDENESEDEDNDNDNDQGGSRSRPSVYTRDTLYQIIEWRPTYWWIPEKKDLDKVAKYVPQAPELGTRHNGRVKRFKRYFSAAAAAIQFLERLTPKKRAQVRKIVIQEDYASLGISQNHASHTNLGLSQTHARGLVPYLLENPRLRIERRIDIWGTVLIPNRERSYGVERCLWDVATWIHEASMPWIMDLPTGSFSLVLYGPDERASELLCNAMRQAAMWQDGAEELTHRGNMQGMTPIADDFVDVVKAVVRGDVPVRFEAGVPELWDIDEILREQSDQWPYAVDRLRCVTVFHFGVPPDGGWDSVRSEQMEEIEWTDGMVVRGLFETED